MSYYAEQTRFQDLYILLRITVFYWRIALIGGRFFSSKIEDTTLKRKAYSQSLIRALIWSDGFYKQQKASSLSSMPSV